MDIQAVCLVLNQCCLIDKAPTEVFAEYPAFLLRNDIEIFSLQLIEERIDFNTLFTHWSFKYFVDAFTN